MHKLLEYIDDNTGKNTKEIQEAISGMICEKDALIPLSEENLLSALKIKGEFLALKLRYEDFEDEMQSHIIKCKISQALSVIVSYEDDGKSYETIETFVQYVHDASDVKQNSTFGLKKVSELSEFPITILFSGILPINQLRMSVGKKVYEQIHSDDEYFVPRFQEFRDNISREIDVPILPLIPMLDEYLDDYQVRLIDMLDGRVISDFKVVEDFNKDTIEIYLQKLFNIYKSLAKEKCLGS